MRRFASVAVMAITAWFLIATSRVPCSATAESVTVTARTTCGPDTQVTVALNTSCGVTVTPSGSGLPRSGSAANDSTGRLVNRALYLPPDGFDGGSDRECRLSPNDAGTGWSVDCTASCDADAGCDECSGTLSP